MGRKSNARQRLIAGMAELAHRNGYTAAGVDAVCDTAQVRKGSFYYFFASKRDLMLAALDRQWMFARQHIDAAFATDLKPLERIARFFSLAAKGEASNKKKGGYVLGCPFGGLAVETRLTEPLLAERADAAIRTFTASVRSCLTEAVASGEVPAATDLDDASEAIAAYFQGVALLARTRNDPALFRRLGRRAVLLAAGEPPFRRPAGTR